MQLSIHDQTLKRVGFINNNLPDALHYFDDNWHRYLAEGTSTFDFSVNKVNSSYALLTLQSYISFTYDGEDYLFNIINIEQDHYSMHLQCENLNLALISEEVGAYVNTKRHSIVWYLKNAAKITDDLVEIGNNPFPLVDEDVSNPILSFDNDETKLYRIISICKSFNAEFQFKTQLKNDGTLQNITIDLYKDGGVGQKRKDVTLYYGKNIVGISSKADRTSTFFNAATVTDSKDKFNWLSVEGKYYNSEGQLEFYKNAGDNTAYAPLSRDMFPSQLKSASSDRYTRKNLSIEATSANSLWDYAVIQFKQYAYPQMTYEVSVAVNAVTSALGNNRKLDIGDTITVQDNTFDKSEGGLILSARVSEQEISFTNPQSNKIIFTNFVRLKSDISSDLYGRMKDLVDQNTPYRFEIVSDNGLTFKNSTRSTTLTARVYKGSNIDEVSVDSFEWLIDGVSFGGITKSQLVSASQVTGTAVVRYNAKLGDTVIGGVEVTLQYVSDGADGISPTVKVNPDTSLTIVDAQGTKTTPVLKGTDGIAGKDGVGVKTTVITYAISTSGTTAPTTGWTSSVPSLVKGQYLWTKTVWTYTDNSSETGYSVTYISKDGNNGTNGIAGKDGVGIQTTTITYAGSTSGATAPTSGWTSAVPTVAAGSFLWTKTVWAYTDNTSETGYSVAGMGLKGDKGDPGTQGLKGSDGTNGTNGINGANGQDAITIVMTNDNVTLPANAQGGVLSYANSGTTFSVLVGNIQCIPLPGTPVSVENSFSVVSSYSGIVVGSKTIDATGKVISYGNHAGMSAISGATATITYTVTVRANGTNTTFTKIQNISKTEKGITGDDGIDNFTYFRYSPYPDGKNMTSLPNADSKYLGIVVTTSATAPNDKSSYSWSKYAGNDANKNGDNVIFNPKWDNVPYGVVRFNDMADLGWNISGTGNLLLPGDDAPGENVFEVVTSDGYIVAKGIPVVAGERYIFSAQIRTNYPGSNITSPIEIRMYPSTNDWTSTSSGGFISQNFVRINGQSSGDNLIDVSNFPAITDSNWNTRSFVVEIPAGVSHIRLVLWNRGPVEATTKYRKLELRKQQQGAVVKAATEPSYKYVGMQWQYTGTSAITIGGIAIQPSTIYIWSGSVWQLYVMRSTNLQVDNAFITNAMIKNATIDSAKIKNINADKIVANSLSALSANLGDVSAGTVKLMADVNVNGTLKKYGLYQSKLGLLSSGAALATTSAMSNTQMGVANLNKGELRFIVTDYTENLKDVQDAGMSDQNNAFIKFDSYDNGKDVMTIGSSGDIVFKGNTSQDTQWVKMTEFAYYKVMFGRVNIRVGLTSGSSMDNIYLGTVPNKYKSPNGDMMLPAQAWSINTGLDRHVQYTTDGNLYLLNPEPNTKYVFEASYTL